MTQHVDVPARGLGLILLLCVMGGAGVPQPAQAQQTEVETDAGVEHCISPRLLRERVRRASTSPIDDDLILHVTVARNDDEYRMKVAVRDPLGTTLGERELVTRALRCEDLDDAIVLVSVLMLDSASLRRQVEAARHSNRPWSLGPSAGIRFRSLPSAHPDVGLSVLWARDRMSVNARVFLGGETSVRAAEGSFTLRALGLDARACYAVAQRGVLALGPCAAATIAQLRGQTTGLLIDNRSVRSPHLRAGLGIEARIRAGRWVQLVPALVVDLAITRNVYRFNQFATAREAFRVPLVGVRAELALLVRMGAAP